MGPEGFSAVLFFSLTLLGLVASSLVAPLKAAWQGERYGAIAIIVLPFAVIFGCMAYAGWGLQGFPWVRVPGESLGTWALFATVRCSLLVFIFFAALPHFVRDEVASLKLSRGRAA